MVIFWSFCPPKMIHRNTRYRDSTRTKNVVSVKKNLNVRETDSSVLVASLGYLFSRNNRNDYRVNRDERYHYRDNRNGYREAELVLANWQHWQAVRFLTAVNVSVVGQVEADTTIKRPPKPTKTRAFNSVKTEPP